MTWYGKHIRKKYRWRQVLWADALIQMPRKTGERNPGDLFVPRSISFPMNPEKKTLIPYIYNVSIKDPF